MKHRKQKNEKSSDFPIFYYKKEAEGRALRLSLFFFCSIVGRDFFDLRVPIDDFSVIAAKMRKNTVRTDLCSFFGISEVSSAFIPQGIERAIAEQTIEILGL